MTTSTSSSETEVDAPQKILPPSTADYWVGSLIGQGTFASVVYAQHKISRRPVAIKVMDPTTARKYPASILQEQRILSTTLRGTDYVVNLGSSFYDSQCLYLVFELCEGGDLEHWIHDHHSTAIVEDNDTTQYRSRLSSIPFYLQQLQEAIHAIHAKQIIHCDIKPANVLLTAKGRVKLADFGSALDLLDRGGNRQSEAGTIPRGTTEYSAPELIRNQYHRNHHPQAMDIWSFACVALAMYLGNSPFHRDASESLCVQAILAYADDQNGEARTFWENLSVLGSYCRLRDKNDEVRMEMLQYQHLLQSEPAARCQTWQQFNLSPAAPHTIDLHSRQPNFPIAKWRKDVDSCDLQDGAKGWALFMMLSD